MNRNLDVTHIVSLLKNVLKKENTLIPLHQPVFRGKEWVYVKDCLDSGWVSSVGKYVDEFEKRLAEYIGVKHVIAVVNGTAAMHICLKLAGVEEGDEVLLPALTFVATANAVHYCGGIPHFVDSDLNSFGIHPKKLQEYLEEISFIKQGCCYNKLTMRPIKAVVAVHAFGHPVDLDPLLAICEKHKLVLIEDAAEALGSYYKNKHVGNWGSLSALSFNGNKVITTGGGGAILTNDSTLAKIAKHLTTTAKVPHPWAFVHDQVGYNYRLPNINAALGCGQIELIDEFLQQKRTLAQKYHEVFQKVQGMSLFIEPAYARSNYWLNVLLLDEEYIGLRDPLLLATHEKGILTRPSWTLLHKLTMFQECPQMDLSIAQSLEQRMINIPSGAGLGEDDGET